MRIPGKGNTFRVRYRLLLSRHLLRRRRCHVVVSFSGKKGGTPDRDGLARWIEKGIFSSPDYCIKSIARSW